MKGCCDFKAVHRSRTLLGHEATIFLACFTSDSSRVVTGCHNGVLKLWSNDSGDVTGVTSAKALATIRDAHDLGITCGECSPVAGE